MHGGAGDLHPVVQGGLMHPQPVEALTAEAGDQGRVDVQNPLGPFGGKVTGENGHKARQHDHVDAVFFQGLLQSRFKARLAPQLLFQQGQAGNICLLCPLQGVGTGGVGHHQGDFAAVEDARFLGIDEGLQIGSAAGNQNRDPGAHSRITFSSPGTTVPMT